MAKTTKTDTDSGKQGAKLGKPGKGGKPMAPKPNIFARLGQYFKDVRGEMKRVVWPTRPEVLNSSVVVVVTLIFFVFFTLIFDSIAYQALRLMTGS